MQDLGWDDVKRAALAGRQVVSGGRDRRLKHVAVSLCVQRKIGKDRDAALQDRSVARQLGLSIAGVLIKAERTVWPSKPESGSPWGFSRDTSTLGVNGCPTTSRLAGCCVN